MTNANTESLVVEFKKEVAKMREREATDLEIQSMLEFVEQLTRWRGDVDREPLINALREAAVDGRACLGGFVALSRSLFSGWEHCEEIGCLVVAVVTHPILLVRHRIFAFTRLMAVAPTLALALILGHLVPPYSAALICSVAECLPHARA